MRKKLVASILLLVIAISIIVYYVTCISLLSSVYDYKALSSYVAIAPYSRALSNEEFSPGFSFKNHKYLLVL